MIINERNLLMLLVIQKDTNKGSTRILPFESAEQVHVSVIISALESPLSVVKEKTFCSFIL